MGRVGDLASLGLKTMVPPETSDLVRPNLEHAEGCPPDCFQSLALSRLWQIPPPPAGNSFSSRSGHCPRPTFAPAAIMAPDQLHCSVATSKATPIPSA